MMKQQKIWIKTLLIAFFFILVLFNVCFCNTKYAKDYSAVDYVKIKNIVSQDKIQTKELIDKYDFDKDYIITDLDADIVRQMLDGYYDSYLVTGKYRCVIRRNK